MGKKPIYCTNMGGKGHGKRGWGFVAGLRLH